MKPAPRTLRRPDELIAAGLAAYGGMLHLSGVAPWRDVVAALRRPA